MSDHDLRRKLHLANVRGVQAEWHLIRANPFQDIEFGFISWFAEKLVPLVAAFSLARFASIRSIGNSVTGDAPKHVVVELGAKRPIVLSSKGDHRLKSFQCLECSFEADGARVDAYSGCGLGHDRADQIVSQDMCPYLLAHEFWRLAT